MLALGATLLFRLWLAAALPVTADEAYFILWGRTPALGYYDHPPMVGWLLAPLAALSEAPWLLRLPAVLLPPAVALMLHAALVRWFERDAQTADLAALAVLLMPASVWNVLITTDTPLVLFSVAAALVLARAAQRDSGPQYFAAGVLLGLAFLSKYFAVLLGLAFLAWAALARRPRALALILLGALPFGLVNLYWNYEACWCNVMFNGINRHVEGHSGWSPSKPALYAAGLAYLAAPLFWFAWRGRRRLAEAWRRPAEGALLLAWGLPLAVFTLLAPVKTIGLHWLLSFLPPLVASLALALEPRALRSSVRWFALLAVVHMVPIAVIGALPLETWKATWIYPRMVFPGRTPALLAALREETAGKVLATDSYAASALVEYYARRPVLVFGRGTSHARQDDIDTDWRTLEGKDIVIVRRQPAGTGAYAPYFRRVDEKVVTLGGGSFHVYIGSGFDYAVYRAGVLADIREHYYRIPAWLPVGRCYFFERYFPGGPAS